MTKRKYGKLVRQIDIAVLPEVVANIVEQCKSGSFTEAERADAFMLLAADLAQELETARTKSKESVEEVVLSEKFMAQMRKNYSIDKNGDPVGAKPDVGWETGYAAGIRCFYRILRDIYAAAPKG